MPESTDARQRAAKRMSDGAEGSLGEKVLKADRAASRRAAWKRGTADLERKISQTHDSRSDTELKWRGEDIEEYRKEQHEAGERAKEEAAEAAAESRSRPPKRLVAEAKTGESMKAYARQKAAEKLKGGQK